MSSDARDAVESFESFESFESATRDLAHAYIGSPPGPMLREAAGLRTGVVAALRGEHRPDQRRDLHLIAGRLSGVLAYAALDLGRPGDAAVHAAAAWRCGEYAGHNGLRAWARGTQSLTARFTASYGEALDFVHGGHRFATTGTSLVRLYCGEAQCLANLGDAAGAHRALDLAEGVRERSTGDEIGGLFGFSLAKQHYYAASSLIWLHRNVDAERARREAVEAIGLFAREAPEDRSLDDEALAHVYLGTACVTLHDLDAAADATAPVFDLPRERRISWIGRRLDRLAGLLRARPFDGSGVANELREKVRQFHRS